MKIVIKRGNRSARAWIVNLFTICILLICQARGQATHSIPNVPAVQVAEKDRAMSALRSGEFAPYDVEVVSKAKAKDAIPLLEQQFASDHDELLKAKIAQALVELGDKNSTAWNYLVALATHAVNSDAPEFMVYSAEGKAGPGPSTAFQAWVTTHKLDMETEWQNAIYIYPGELLLLGETKDVRALPVLRQALKSPNYQMQVMAALELAQLQDVASIPLIIEASERAPRGAANQIASNLVAFDDPRAQTTVDQFVDKDFAKTLRNSKAQGHTLLH